MSTWYEGCGAHLCPSLGTAACGLAGTHLVCSLLVFSAGWWLEPVVSFAKVQMAIFRKDACPFPFSLPEETLLSCVGTQLDLLGGAWAQGTV